MAQYLLHRLFQAIFTAFGVLVIVFFMLRLTGDPTTALLTREASAEEREEFRHAMGWDKPVTSQFVDYVAGLARGDFGRSYKYRLPATTLLLERLPATIELALAGMALAILVGVPIGTLGAAKPQSAWAVAADFMGVIGLSTPSFWVGLMLIILLSVNFGLFPAAGRSGLKSLVLPAITMSLASLARIVRMTRATMTEILHEDYIRTAHAKGLPKRTINFRHALRNASIPVVTLIGVNFGYMLGGSVVVETVFSWPGIGWLTYQAMIGRDFVLVQAIAIFTSWVILILNLFTDFLYGVLDPRIRVGR